MSAAPTMVETDVLVIGSGRCRHVRRHRGGTPRGGVLLVDRSLIGRGGATVMAQMTVAAALGEETPDDWHYHYADTLAAGRGLCDEKLAQLVCEEGPDCIRELDRLGRRLGAQGRAHHRSDGAGPRSAALRLCRFPQYRAGGIENAAHAMARNPGHPQSRRPLHCRSCRQRRRGHRRGGLSSRHRRAGRRLRPRRPCWRPAG